MIMKRSSMLLITVSLIVFSFASLAIGQDWTPDPTCPYPSDVPTRYPYYGNCSLYWECFQGAKYVMECPEGLEFNAELSQCDTPSIANCEPYASTSPGTHGTGTVTTPIDSSTTPHDQTTQSNDNTTDWAPDPMCPYPSDEFVYFPYEGDCGKYWACYAGNKYEYTCPDGLWWNQAISVCDYPENVVCDDNSTTTATQSQETTPITDLTTSTSSKGTTDDDDGGWPKCEDQDTSFWPHPTDCSKYIECYQGQPYEMNCPPDTFYSESVGLCVSEGESECCAEIGGC